MTTSVAMCTYNGAQFIEEQLRSILDQTFHVEEVVVCDDRSVDETVAIIERVAKETSIPIHIHINETNLGCARNFEKAISLCNGDVIFLSDQDDIWMPNKVETIVNWFKANPTKEYVTLEGFKALEKVANGQSTKLIIPSELTSLASTLAAAKEVVDSTKNKK